MKGEPVSARKVTMAVIVGMRVVAKVEADGGNEVANTAMLCGVVILIFRSSPRDNKTSWRFCMAWIRALGSMLSSSVAKYSLPTAMATMEVEGMNGAIRAENQSSAADLVELMLATWLFSTATMRSMPELEKAWRI